MSRTRCFFAVDHDLCFVLFFSSVAVLSSSRQLSGRSIDWRQTVGGFVENVAKVSNKEE